MRSVLIENFNQTSSNDFVLTGDDAFHLSRVVRLKIGDEVQILNGHGICYKSIVKNITKNEVILNLSSSFQSNRPHAISLLCGKPKKNTCEEIIRLSIELGVVNLFFWDSEYAQEVEFSDGRLNQIIKNSMEQSNNYWQPQIHFVNELASSKLLDGFLKTSRSYIFHNKLDPLSKCDLASSYKLSDPALIIIGPEGGLSLKDLEGLKNYQNQNCNFVNLPSPILTTPTAVASSMGYLFALAYNN